MKNNFPTTVGNANVKASLEPSFIETVNEMAAFVECHDYTTDLAEEFGQTDRLESNAPPTLLSLPFYTKWDSYWKRINQFAATLRLTGQSSDLYRLYLQSRLHPWMMTAPFCSRIFHKPRGYAGDYLMMRMIADHAIEGRSLVSRLLDAHALGCPLSEAARNRNTILCDKIAASVKGNGTSKTAILSIASGPALEIQALIERHPELAQHIDLTLLDQDARALKSAGEVISRRCDETNSTIDLRYVHHRVHEFLVQSKLGRDLHERFDLIYAFGIFDYFDDDTCTACINLASRLVRPGGKLLVSNYSLDGHHHRGYLEYAFEWYLRYRSTAQMERLAQSSTRPCSISTWEDPTRVIKFLELRFDESANAARSV